MKEPPIILCGCPRSGTTLLLSILDAHPEIQGIQVESRIFKKWPYQSSILNKWLHKFLIAKQLIKHPIKRSAMRWVEKTPQNIQYIDRIIDEFESDVRIIHIVRDGRDVVTSKHPNFPDRFFVNPKQWASIVSHGLKWMDHPQVLTIRYEKLVKDYESALDQLMVFLDLKVHESMARFHESTSIKDPSTLADELEPLYTKSIGKWKDNKYSERLSEFNNCGEAVEVLRKLDMK